MRKRFRYNCIDCPSVLIKELNFIKDNKKEINYRAFLTNIDKVKFSDICEDLGYAHHYTKGMIIKDDPYVSYYKCKLPHSTAYIMIHSAIEYVFY